MVLSAIPEDHDLRTQDGEADMDTDGTELLDLRGGNVYGGGTFLTIRRG